MYFFKLISKLTDKKVNFIVYFLIILKQCIVLHKKAHNYCRRESNIVRRGWKWQGQSGYVIEPNISETWNSGVATNICT